MKFRTMILGMILVAPGVVFSAADDFTRTLKVGMRGEDVRALQVVLNADPETRIVASGAGSPGGETDYFGPATKRALIKFQEKYRAEVLVPAGLTAGTGVFGEKSRAKATLLRATKTAVSQSAPSKTTEPAPAVAPVANFLSAYTGAAGTSLEISGENFASQNTVYFGDTSTPGASSNGTTIKILIPDITPGVYRITVAHQNGKSIDDRVFAVTKKGAVAPVVKSVTPDHAARGATLTISGTGFAQNSMIRAGVGDFPATLALDGTLSVRIPENTLAFVAADPTKKISIPVWLYVLNENGMSNAVRFTLEL